MDLLTLKSLPLTPLPVINAILGSIPVTTSTDSSRSSPTETIAQNILSIGSVSEPVVNSYLAIWDKVFSQPIVSPDFKSLATDILSNFRPSNPTAAISQLYETSIPLSVAVEKFNLHFDQQETFSKDNFLKLSNFSAQLLDGLSNSKSSFQIPYNFFQTSQPLSILKEVASKYQTQSNSKRSIPNRQPYESKNKEKSGSKKSSSGLTSLFQLYLRSNKRLAE